MPETLEQFVRRYERATNSRDFEEVAPLIADDATFIFTDGTFKGRDAIHAAFEDTWSHILDEKYELSNIQWIAKSDEVAVFTYNFRSDGMVNGSRQVYEGQGTNALVRAGDSWQIMHEHLSKAPSAH